MSQEVPKLQLPPEMEEVARELAHEKGMDYSELLERAGRLMATLPPTAELDTDV